MQEEEDPEKIIEESRRRRQAILEKYNKQKVQSNVEPPSKNQYRGKIFVILLYIPSFFVW